MRFAPTGCLLVFGLGAGALGAGCDGENDDQVEGSTGSDASTGSTGADDPTTSSVPSSADPDAAAPVEGGLQCPRARVAVPGGGNLNVRQSPNTTAAIVGSLPNNTVVTVIERVTGEEVSGTSEWLKVRVSPKEGFVSAAFAKCTSEPAPDLQPPGAFRLPLECGKSAKISQGNDGAFSHTGYARFAFDFAVPANTPLVAIAEGIVSHTFAGTQPGDACYNGGDLSCKELANYVVLRHGDGTYSNYKHLNKVLVTVGQLVATGKPVGLSGGTGYSTGPHAHVVRQKECAASQVTSCDSIQVSFADVAGNGIPVTGQTVTSDNGCP